MISFKGGVSVTNTLDRAAVARMIEATKLGPGVTVKDVRDLVEDVVELGIGGVICVPPMYV